MTETMPEMKLYRDHSALLNFMGDQVAQTKGCEYHIAIYTYSFTCIRNDYFFLPVLWIANSHKAIHAKREWNVIPTHLMKTEIFIKLTTLLYDQRNQWQSFHGSEWSWINMQIFCGRTNKGTFFALHGHHSSTCFFWKDKKNLQWYVKNVNQ